uniref:Uncharacterized protein n=2 Tax=Canis lupus familiaris TaxID=9615 RepID=A0A8C0M5R0_CANLF
MPENVAPLEGSPTAATGGHSKTTYQDHDKPAQIRFTTLLHKGETRNPVLLEDMESKQHRRSSY